MLPVDRQQLDTMRCNVSQPHTISSTTAGRPGNGLNVQAHGLQGTAPKRGHQSPTETHAKRARLIRPVGFVSPSLGGTPQGSVRAWTEPAPAHVLHTMQERETGVAAGLDVLMPERGRQDGASTSAPSTASAMRQSLEHLKAEILPAASHDPAMSDSQALPVPPLGGSMGTELQDLPQASTHLDSDAMVQQAGVRMGERAAEPAQEAAMTSITPGAPTISARDPALDVLVRALAKNPALARSLRAGMASAAANAQGLSTSVESTPVTMKNPSASAVDKGKITQIGGTSLLLSGLGNGRHSPKELSPRQDVSSSPPATPPESPDATQRRKDAAASSAAVAELAGALPALTRARESISRATTLTLAAARIAGAPRVVRLVMDKLDNVRTRSRHML